MAGKYGLFLSLREIRQLTDLLATKTDEVSQAVYLKLLDLREKVPPDEG